MSATAEAIERLLGRWDERLRRVDDNLLALEADPAHAMAAGPGGRERFDGVSRQRVSEALEEIDGLFADQHRLQTVIAQARAALASSRRPRWGRDEGLVQAEALLLGASISRPVAPTPLEHRGLLDGAARGSAVTPEALLDEMTRRYAAARDALLSVASAWQALEPAMVRVEQRLRALDERGARLGLGPGGLDGMVALRAEVARVRTRVARDPLGSTGAFEGQLAPRLTIVEGAAEAAEARQRQALGQLDEAARVLAPLAARRAEAERRWAALGARVELGPAAATAVPGEDEVASLRERLDRWRQPGAWQQAGGELPAWHHVAQAMRHRIDRVEARARALEAAGDDLAGRLAARRAQLAALRARGQELAEGLEAQADEVRALLERSPRALGRAAARLDALERALAGRAR